MNGPADAPAARPRRVDDSERALVARPPARVDPGLPVWTDVLTGGKGQASCAAGIGVARPSP